MRLEPAPNKTSNLLALGKPPWEPAHLYKERRAMRLITSRSTQRGQRTRESGRRRTSQTLRLEALEDRLLPSLTPAIWPDSNTDAAGANPSQLTVVGSAVFFTAVDGVHGFELWKSNGTP